MLRRVAFDSRFSDATFAPLVERGFFSGFRLAFRRGGKGKNRKPKRPGRKERQANAQGSLGSDRQGNRPDGAPGSGTRAPQEPGQGSPASDRQERDPRPPREPREPRDPRPPREPRDSRQPRDSREPRANNPNQSNRPDGSGGPKRSPLANRGARTGLRSNGPPRDSQGRGPQGGKFRGDRAREERPREERALLPSHVLDEAIDKTHAKINEWVEQARAIQEARAAGGPNEPEFALDPWQQGAVDALIRGESVIVDAPTTAGKTRVVEAFFQKRINYPGFRAVYTTPVKSLSNDKLREFREMFGSQNVGIATGDVKENLSAPIVVATLESYRNSLLGTEPDLGRNLVIFDEYHFLQDDSRGSAWEESIILTPAKCQMVLLSASVDNCNEFKKWIEWLRNKPCHLIQVTHRPVPLTDLIFIDGQWVDPAFLPAKILETPQTIDHKAYKLGMRPNDLARRLKEILPLNLTPCIIYAGRRLACENMAFAAMKAMEPLPVEESRRIGEVLDRCQTEFKALSFIKQPMRQMLQVYGVGYHHSGLAPGARLAVEILVKAGLLRFCAATMGLSIGINFAVRSAVISDYERPGSLGFTEYSPSEVLQMLGRAGRRGRDVVGFSLWHSLASYQRLKSNTREHCASRLRNDPTTFLGLIGQGMDIKALQEFYSKSFHSYSAPKSQELIRSVARMHKHLKDIGTIDEKDSLTNYGSVAKFFPQTGGLFLSREIAAGRINSSNILGAAELMAALCLARFKSPGGDYDYRLPFSEKKVEEQLEELYPAELFPELYDMENQERGRPTLREFNPSAGFIIRAWAMEDMEWPQLLREVTTEYFGTGDVMNIIYRVSTYLQSLVQAKFGELSIAAGALREGLLREPLSFTIGR